MAINMISGRTCKQLITDALRGLGILASGQEATEQEYLDSMVVLRDVLRKFITDGSFGRLKDVIVFDDFTATGNQHIFKQTSWANITLPEFIAASDTGDVRNDYGLLVNTDGDGGFQYSRQPYTCNGARYDIKPPRDCSVVRITDSVSDITIDFIYDGQSKTWQPLYNLDLDYECPLSRRDGEGLKSSLCLMLADQFGVEPTAMQVRLANEFRKGLGARLDQPATQSKYRFF